MEEPLISPAVPEKHKVDVFAMIGPGLEVFDRQGQRVGKVDGFYPGAGELHPTETTVLPAPTAPLGQQTLPVVEPVVVPTPNVVTVPEFDTVIRPDEDFPKELLERLQHNGFIKIDAGFLHHHRYALREQIERVEDNRVILNVAEDELIKH